MTLKVFIEKKAGFGGMFPINGNLAGEHFIEVDSLTYKKDVVTAGIGQFVGNVYESDIRVVIDAGRLAVYSKDGNAAYGIITKIEGN